MDSSIEKYIADFKKELNENFLSPQFVRLANLLYINKKYEDCIKICKTGLEIYPNYLTAKLILLKAFIKAEYLGEAEVLIKDIANKIDNKNLLSRLEKMLVNLRSASKQEKIYYPESLKTRYDFSNFNKKFNPETENPEINITDFLSSKNFQENNFGSFKEEFESFKFGIFSKPAETVSRGSSDKSVNTNEDFDSDFGKIKIVTETLADIFAQQGNYKDAFEAYNFLLRAGTPDKARIKEKIHEIERNMSKDKEI